MSKEKEGQEPFQALGEKLRRLRELHNETLAEVSGAVEIDQEALESIESGQTRPSEDILFLLSSHFQSSKKQADKLFTLAGYQRPEDMLKDDVSADSFTPQPAMMILPIDSRIVYTDAVNVSANDHGVVMNFMQNAGPNGSQLAVSKVGMSKEHAKNLLALLQKTLNHLEKPRQLSQPSSKPKPNQSEQAAK